MLRVCFLGVALAAAGCGNQYAHQVIGTWDTDLKDQPQFTLNGDGTGSRYFPDTEKTTKMTWRINRDTLILQIEGRMLSGTIKKIDRNSIVLHDARAKKDFTFTRLK